MLLTIAERLNLLTVLPEKGDLSTLKIVREIREALSFTEQEHKQYKIVAEDQGGGLISWQWDAAFNDVQVEIKFGPKMAGLALRQLEQLDKEERLEERHLSLCEKFGYGEEV
jgi:hypothetical protein